MFIDLFYLIWKLYWC